MSQEFLLRLLAIECDTSRIEKRSGNRDETG